MSPRNVIKPGAAPKDPFSRARAPGSFVALDFETADTWRDSACQIAVVRVEGLKVVDRIERLIRPPRQRFMFTGIHGITWNAVKNEPTFGELWSELAPWFAGVKFVAAHNAPFDRSVLNACCHAIGVAPPAVEFRCTMKLARDLWSLHPTRLPDVCAYLRIPLEHHNAGSDAEACARIMIAAARAGASL